MSLEINENRLKPADPVFDGPNILQRADLAWSRMELKSNEYLLVKVSNHLADHINDIRDMIDHCFKKDNDRVILFLEGDVEFSRVSFDGDKKVSDHRFA